MANRLLYCLVMLFMSLPASAGEDVVERALAAIMAELEIPEAKQSYRPKAFLINPRFYRRLKPHTARIRPFVTGSPESELDMEILALLDTTAQDRAAIIASKWPSFFIKARAGDQQAYAEVERAFLQATDEAEIQHTALRLLYVGNHQAMQVFARRLGSAETITTRGPHPAFPHITLVPVPGSKPLPLSPHVVIIQSVALLLIEVYCQVEHHDEDGIDATTYLKHLEIDPPTFTQPEHQAYLRRVETVFTERHGIKVTLTCPALRYVVD